MTDVGASLEEYRDVREALERAVLPLATSVDGRRFSFQTSLHELELEAGGYVTLDDEGSPRLGQVLSLELRTETATGRGLPEEHALQLEEMQRNVAFEFHGRRTVHGLEIALGFSGPPGIDRQIAVQLDSSAHTRVAPL